MNKFFKFLMALSMAFVLTSCGTVGMMIHTAKTYDGANDYNCGDDIANDTIHFVISKKNQLLFKAEINGKTDTVMYDSGVNFFALMMYTPSTKPEGMKFYNISISGADKRTKVKATTLPVKIRTDMVVSEGLGMAALNPEPPVCEKETYLAKHDIIGFRGINMTRYMLDFSKNQIYHLPASIVIDTTEFIPIKCKFYKDVLWVYPRINGVEYECLFDTGNGAAGIFLQDEQRIATPRDGDYVFEGSYGVAVGGVTEKQHFLVAPVESLSMAGDDKEVDVMYVKSMSSNNMGLKAILKYDWIIAGWGENPKVYVRPHVADEVKPFKAPSYRVSVIDGTLKILTRLIDGNEKFNVGDQIVSVNGEKITEENICHYYDLLTENKDWSEFEIQVK